MPVAFAECKITSAGDTVLVISNTTPLSQELIGWSLDLGNAHRYELGKLTFAPGATVEIDLNKIGARLLPEGGTINLINDKKRFFFAVS